jgi:hypothetical protein
MSLSRRQVGGGHAGQSADLRNVAVAGLGAAGPEETEETLRDGRVVTVRPLRAGDATGVEALWRRLDARARRRFTNLAHLPSERVGDLALPRRPARRGPRRGRAVPAPRVDSFGGG